MPLLASFEDVDLIPAYLTILFCWPVAAGLALLALILAFWPRTRQASKWCAIACMVASIPIGLADVSFIVHPIQMIVRHTLSFQYAYPPSFIAKLCLSFVPLGLAIAVFWFDARHLKR